VLYLLDANVLIDADRDYYPLDRVPEFWEWLLFQAKLGNIKVCIEVYEEVTAGTGDLVDWMNKHEVKTVLQLAEETDPALVKQVVEKGYAADLTDEEIISVGRDPFLIAHALKSPEDRRVVTTERSAPSRKRQNRKVPDVSKGLGVQPRDTFQLLRELNFTTSWNDDGIAELV
jgi:hypothetical protein